MDNGGERMGEVASRAKHQAEELAANVQDQLEGVRGYAEDAGAWIREFARERPFAAVAIAAGLGFLAGRLLSRT